MESWPQSVAVPSGNRRLFCFSGSLVLEPLAIFRQLLFTFWYLSPIFSIETSLGSRATRSRVDYEGLPARLRFLRQTRGLSYHALARLSGVTHTALHQIEAGNNIPGLDTTEKIAVALGVDPRWFAYGVGDPAANSVFHISVTPGFDPLHEVEKLRSILQGQCGYIDDLYKYLDPIGASDWVTLRHQQDFAKEVDAVPIKAAAARVINELRDGAFDILGLGAGTAVHELGLLLQLKSAVDARLFLLDVSQPLLVAAGQTASRLLPRERHVPVIGVLGDFHQLPSYAHLFESHGTRRRVVTMFGYTFGNLTNEVRFVRGALSWLSRGDLLLLDVARALAPADRPDLMRKAEPLSSSRRSSPWVRQVEAFLTGPILRYGKGIREITVEPRLDVHSCVVPGSYAMEGVATVHSDGQQPRRFSVGHTKRYDVEKLKDCLRTEDWHMIEHWSYADDRCMLCLFERGTAKPKRPKRTKTAE